MLLRWPGCIEVETLHSLIHPDAAGMQCAGAGPSPAAQPEAVAIDHALDVLADIQHVVEDFIGCTAILGAGFGESDFVRVRNLFDEHIQNIPLARGEWGGGRLAAAPSASIACRGSLVRMISPVGGIDVLGA